MLSKESKGSILHEIQHAIQNEEGFEEGAHSGFLISKKSYYDSLGETEATNVKQRYINNDYFSVPESSKSKAKHIEYDTYMKNRNGFDKIKDYIYTKTKGEMLNGQNYKNNKTIPKEVKNKNSRYEMGRKNLKDSNMSSFSLPIKENGIGTTYRNFIENTFNFGEKGTRTNLEDIKLPTKEYFENKNKESATNTEEAVISKAKKITRKDIQKQLLAETDVIKDNLDNANNLSMVNIVRTDPIRLQEKVFGKVLGAKINAMFFYRVKHNTAEKIRFSNRERNDIRSWGIKAGSKESEILQKYTEKQYVNAHDEVVKYTELDLKHDIKDEATRDKIRNASKQLRQKYDKYIDTVNPILTELGYDPIHKRTDYVRHFNEMNDILTRFGIPGKFQDTLPTDINGITNNFRPGKNYFANTQQRIGVKTTYDAITGIDGYIEGISNLIYHTEDIQRLRAFDNYIRDIYGKDGFEHLDNLNEDEVKSRIDKILNNHLSNYVSWLTEYTNNLAGKKSMIDRSVESIIGRKVYSALDTAKKQVGSNMTGLNLGSALTNFISAIQGASKTKKLSLLKGTAKTIQNIFRNDDFIEKSDFLTNRFGSDRLSNKLWQKVSNAGQVFMSATDYFTSNLIVRSKYYENLSKGMSEKQAIKSADDFAARVLGDRAQGATPNIFNSKMLGIVTQFQLEVNNQIDFMIHDTVQDFKTDSKDKGTLKASMGAVWTLGQLFAFSHVFNNLFESIAGRRPAFDIVDIIMTAFGWNDDDDDTAKDNLHDASKKLIEALPFLNLFSENARIPISSAIPNPLSVATGDSDLNNELNKLIYLLPPTGGSQIKKSIEGIKTVAEGGSYVTNANGEKELRFPVENATALDYVKAGVLGKYALPMAKEYIDNDYKRLSAKQTKLYEETKLPYKQLLDYIDAGLTKTEDKINYVKSQDMTENQKWGIYKYNILSSTERDDGSSQVSDAEYMIKNGVSKSEYMNLYNKAVSKNIDMPTADEYKEMKKSGLSLNKYIDYNIKVKDTTEKKKRAGELKESQSLKDADRIQILLDSNYSDKEIKAIYENYICNKNDSNYNIMKSTNIDIKEYIKYRQQKFESDKKDDGTVDGKSISGSKKKKVYSYVNSMKINYNQKLLLLGQQYKLTTTERTKLANYVNSLRLTKQEKLDIYDKLEGFTVYKNGTVKW